MKIITVLSMFALLATGCDFVYNPELSEITRVVVVSLIAIAAEFMTKRAINAERCES